MGEGWDLGGDPDLVGVRREKGREFGREEVGGEDCRERKRD